MDIQNRKIRQYLKKCPRKEYENLVYESKLTPNQAAALNCIILEDKSLLETGDVLNCSGRTVSKLINQAYAKIRCLTIK